MGNGGERRELGTTPQSYRHSDVCFEMGSDESHFNVSLIVRGKDTRVHKPQFLKRKEGRSVEPTRHRSLPCLRPLPLGQTGSQQAFIESYLGETVWEDWTWLRGFNVAERIHRVWEDSTLKGLNVAERIQHGWEDSTWLRGFNVKIQCGWEDWTWLRGLNVVERIQHDGEASTWLRELNVVERIQRGWEDSTWLRGFKVQGRLPCAEWKYVVSVTTLCDGLPIGIRLSCFTFFLLLFLYFLYILSFLFIIKNVFLFGCWLTHPRHPSSVWFTSRWYLLAREYPYTPPSVSLKFPPLLPKTDLLVYVKHTAVGVLWTCSKYRFKGTNV